MSAAFPLPDPGPSDPPRAMRTGSRAPALPDPAADPAGFRAQVDATYRDAFSPLPTARTPLWAYAMARVLAQAARRLAADDPTLAVLGLSLAESLADARRMLDAGGHVKVYLEPNPGIAFLDDRGRPHRESGRPAVILGGAGMAWFCHGELLGSKPRTPTT